MQSSVIRLRHVQTNLFTCDCQYFHNEKIFVRTTEVKQCVLITKKCCIPFLALSQSELRIFFMNNIKVGVQSNFQFAFFCAKIILIVLI